MEKVPDVKITISYKGIDTKWFSSLDDEHTLSGLLQKDGTMTFPSVTVKFGEHATMPITRDYKVDSSSSEGSVVPCGIIVELSPRLEGDGIRISGSSILRYATNKSVSPTRKSGWKGVATRFIAQENLISLKFEDGATKTVDIEGGGQMVITATLIDYTGRPIKK